MVYRGCLYIRTHGVIQFVVCLFSERIPRSSALQACCVLVSDWVTNAVDGATLSLDTPSNIRLIELAF